MCPPPAIKVIDFGMLLPGPLASLMLAAAGAPAIKLERRGRGDELRGYQPRFGTASVGFARGRRDIALDLEANRAGDRLMPVLRFLCRSSSSSAGKSIPQWRGQRLARGRAPDALMTS